MKPIEGASAIVTGAGRGIGRAIALRLSELGAKLVLVARSKDQVEETAKMAAGPSAAFPCDITSAEAPQSIVSTAINRYGRLDLLVHSAGVMSVGPIETASLQNFDEMSRANVRAPYALTMAAIPALKRSKGQVVFVNSTIVRAGNVAERAAYAATQHALRAIADGLRDEVNGDGVRVTSIMVGRTATPRQQELLGDAYRPEFMLTADDIARSVCDALTMPPSAEITDIFIRPMRNG